MSSNLNSRTVKSCGRPPENAKNGGISQARRTCLLALLTAPFAGAISPAQAAAFANADPTAKLTRWGTGEFRRFGFLVYEATLWAPDDPQYPQQALRPPLALKLTYKRNIDGVAIADASVKEIRQFELTDEATLGQWGERMRQLFPNVKPGDHLLGHYQPGAALFYFNDQLIGRIDDPAFARAFFSIWLDRRTSAPDLRAALLRRATGT